MSRKILYIHGFASTGVSPKAEQLRAITGLPVISPTLTHCPAADIAELERIVTTEGITTVVGSSLGGFYALYLAQRFDVGAVLVNPSLTPYESLADAIGYVPVYGTDRAFAWTPKHVQELADAGAVVDLALSTESAVTWSKVLGLYAVHDERLDYRVSVQAMPWTTMRLDNEQDHRFANLMPYADDIRAITSACSCEGEPALL